MNKDLSNVNPLFRNIKNSFDYDIKIVMEIRLD